MKQKSKRKVVSFLLTVAVAIGFIPCLSTIAYADPLPTNGPWGEEGQAVTYDVYANTTIGPADPVIKLQGYINLVLHDGAKLTVNGSILGEGDDDTLTISSQGNGTGTLSVTAQSENDGIKALDVTINDVTVNVDGNGSGKKSGICASRDLKISGGTVNVGQNTQFGHGLYVGNGSANITGGTVNVKGKENAVFLGENAGTLTISGGTVTAESQVDDAMKANNISITGGNVTANYTGNDLKAGLSARGNLTIKGGSVKVEQGYFGLWAGSGTIDISGGNVNVKGSGYGIKFDDGNKNGVEISGGIVTATGTNNDGVNAYNVSISGGKVTASGKAEEEHSGICATTDLTISGGKVTVTPSNYGLYAGNGVVSISGGIVDATGTSTGIYSSGKDADGNAVKITGGQVTASGGVNGIWSNGDNAGDITIDNGKVTATATGEGGKAIAGNVKNANEGTVDGTTIEPSENGQDLSQYKKVEFKSKEIPPAPKPENDDKPVDPKRDDNLPWWWRVDDYDGDYGYTYSDHSEPSREMQTTPVYRLLDASTGEHAFTDSATKRDELIAAGWVSEGIGWYAPKTEGAPAYELTRGDKRFYTKDTNERRVLTEGDYADGGVAFRSNTASTDKPVWRLCSARGMHFFTASEAERDALVEAGWANEGAGFYAA